MRGLFETTFFDKRVNGLDVKTIFVGSKKAIDES
jgi:hypothetical protein